MNIRSAYIFICVSISIAAAYFGSHLIRNNSDANTILITMFTVFAGFLVAVMVIIGDPAMIPAGSWRVAENRRENVERSLVRHMWLFWIYLAVIGLIFLVSILKEAKFEYVEEVRGYVERAYMFMAVFSFLLTLALPKMVSDVQRARVDAEIDKRRNEEKVI